MGTVRVPFITNVKFKLQNFNGFKPEKDVESRLILEKAVEAMVINSISSLMNLGGLFVINKCVKEYCEDRASDNHFLIVENLETGLYFDLKDEPKIMLFNLPGIRSFSVPHAKSFEYSTYGENLNAITNGLQDIHYQFFKKTVLIRKIL